MNNKPQSSQTMPEASPLSGTMIAIAMVGAAAIALTTITLPQTSVIVPFLLLATVLICAARFGVWPGLAAAITAFAAYNFLFVEPYYTFRVARFSDVVTLAVFLMTAGLTGWLAGRLRDEATSSSRRLHHLNHLANLTQSLARTETPDEVLRELAFEAFNLSGAPAIVLIEENGSIHSGFEVPAGARIDDESMPIAARAFSYQAIQPPAAYGSNGRQFAFYPLAGGGDLKFVLALRFPDNVRSYAGELDHAFRQMAAQATSALERIHRSNEAGEARQNAETERLRSGLLLSLSHDLRTPLAGILGAVSSLREPSLKLSASAKADLLLTAEEETRRLSGYVDDLLTLTRLQSGLKPDLTMADANEIAETALQRARSAYPQTRFQLDSPGKPVPLMTDPMLAGQAIFNLLDNAAKHANGAEPVRLAVLRKDSAVSVSVIDDGPGIDSQTGAQVFDPLFRGKDSSGAGLGLAIVKNAATVLGASVELVSPVANGRGTSFGIIFPDKP